MDKLNKRLRLVAILYITILIVLALVPISTKKVFHLPNLSIQFRLDYIIHVIIYLPCIYLMRFGFGYSLFYAIVFSMLLGSFTEGIQYWLPYRTFNINDFIANKIGVFVGSILLIPKLSNLIRKLVGYK